MYQSKTRKKCFLKSKIKENQKQQVLSPVESPICWPDKSFLRTRPISLVSEDNLATNEQLSLSFSKYIHFTNKCYEGVDPTLDPNAYLRSQCFHASIILHRNKGPFVTKKYYLSLICNHKQENINSTCITNNYKTYLS